MKLNRIFLWLVASLFTLFSSGQVAAQAPAPVPLVKAGRLLDPRTGNVLSPAAVLIEDGKIREIGSPAKVHGDAPVGVKTIDLGGATLLPGLIDGHTHLLLDVIVPSDAESARRFNGDFVPRSVRRRAAAFQMTLPVETFWPTAISPKRASFAELRPSAERARPTGGIASEYPPQSRITSYPISRKHGRFSP